jgi:hypothetical membrane protein
VAIPKVAVFSSVLAPVFLIGGWTVAARLQREPFDSISETISALAARDADHRWVMTTALLGVGLCHITTAWNLPAAARLGRITHVLGGAATIAVALFPLPAGATEEDALAHTVSAAMAFLALAIWPALAISRNSRSVLLTPAGGALGAAFLISLLAWFAIDLMNDAPTLGLSERIAAGAQAFWPSVIVLTTRYGQSVRSSVEQNLAR